MRASILLLASATFCFIVGCSKPKGGDVTGSVKIGGKTATSGNVVITNEAGQSATGSIKKDGSYTVTAPPLGKCSVVLTEAPEVGDGFQAPDPKNPPKGTPKTFPIPDKLKKKDTSGLQITVTEAAQTFNIDK